MSLIVGLIFLMIAVTAFAVFLGVWSAGMGNSTLKYPFSLFAIACSLTAITLASVTLEYGHTGDLGLKIGVFFFAASATILSLYQLRICVVTNRWHKSHGKG